MDFIRSFLGFDVLNANIIYNFLNNFWIEDITLKDFFDKFTFYHSLKNKSQEIFDKIFIFIDGSNATMNIICLDPLLSFKKITELNPRAVILSSASLKPINYLEKNLGIKFDTNVSQDDNFTFF